MKISELVSCGANVQLVVNALELKEFFEELKIISEPKEEKKEKYLRVEEVIEMLHVDRSTLWRWNREEYLKTLKIGGKVRYRLSEVEQLMK
ncbi:AlpA family transcriptional regulator [Bacteroides helcogenes]|uniref:Prophage CP4-57 regulatory n=1 Tax=Bacteroides helcogenes (strain ATCC 35417 / DSM 20613 / JCM 6297 / CCUG 15421 / P 36-108) TaxID=693979 RepID=E6SUB4_BACT6|nr:helix-turn-helix domain-containing protein [Bacteroides helcogenes]ADV42332.1 Prophage CP4-57 regulatory [Bacteroides helcogenes P 36-108]MDY5237212.1 helix-turn-helix domain-containing protein [Bacteroides helcogenes]